MPRRKTARRKAPSPEFEIPGLAITKEMSYKEREEQLEIFLKDFQYKVKSSMRAFQVKAARCKFNIANLWDMKLQSLPSSVLDMTLAEFAAAGGTVESALKHKEGKKNEIYMEIEMEIEKRFKRMPLPNDTHLNSIKEELSDENRGPAEESTDVRKPTRPKRTPAAQAPSTLMKPPMRQSTRASRSKYATPAGGLSYGGWGATPAVTPKFDPRLPVTPENAREMKPGERLVMSLAGSPVKVDDGIGRRKPATSSVGLGEATDQLADFYGIDLTPGRLERVLRVGGLIK